MTRERFDQIVLDIEFLLISVVQGVALASLAQSSSEPIARLQIWIWPYILASFLIILIFWSQAIIHALSFIDWPLDLMHNFLYLLASFVEVLAFSHVGDPLAWFAFMIVLFLVAGWLYRVDLALIAKRKKNFSDSPLRRKLYDHIFLQEKSDFKLIVPAGIVYSILSFLILFLSPKLFGNMTHLILIGLQVGFTSFVLISSIRSFKKRSQLITQVIEEKS